MLQSFRTFLSLKRFSMSAAALAALVGLGLSAGHAQAYFEQGDWEIRGAASVENDVNFSGVTATVSAGLGYFITDQFEAGARQVIFYSDIGGPGSTISGTSALFVDYHFGGPDNALQPFVGASIGFQYGDVPDLWLGGPEGGIKWFFNDEGWFVFAEVAYLFFFEDVDAADDAFDDGKFVWGAGIGARIPSE